MYDDWQITFYFLIYTHSNIFKKICIQKKKKQLLLQDPRSQFEIFGFKEKDINKKYFLSGPNRLP